MDLYLRHALHETQMRIRYLTVLSEMTKLRIIVIFSHTVHKYKSRLDGGKVNMYSAAIYR
jgi:hypothetical protein